MPTAVAGRIGQGSLQVDVHRPGDVPGEEVVVPARLTHLIADVEDGDAAES